MRPFPFVCCALVVLLVASPVAAGETQRRQTAEKGLASYYDEEFAGRETASGETFDPDALTAAHPSHAIGTRLRVTNEENGRSVVVRVTDRGPTDENRREGVIVDLSRAAAERLRFTEDGEARVRVERLP